MRETSLRIRYVVCRITTHSINVRFLSVNDEIHAALIAFSMDYNRLYRRVTVRIADAILPILSAILFSFLLLSVNALFDTSVDEDNKAEAANHDADDDGDAQTSAVVIAAITIAIAVTTPAAT